MKKLMIASALIGLAQPAAASERDSAVDKFIDLAYDRADSVKPAAAPRTYTLLDYSTGPYRPIPTQSSYILPYSYMNRPNNEPYPGPKLQFAEVKFQVSFQFPIVPNLAKNHHLYFSYSQLSLWQAFNKELSAPFRETNYAPEFWYAYSFPPLGERGRNLSTGLGFSHESNGRQVKFSRSWNKIVGFAKLVDPRWSLTVKGWSRIAEDPKKSPDDPAGDDNPDLLDYVGFGELAGEWNISPVQQMSLRLRNNLKFHRKRANKGMVEVSYSFNHGAPYWWLVSYFSGHGESLIDYNRNITRWGIGIKIADLAPLR